MRLCAAGSQRVSGTRPYRPVSLYGRAIACFGAFLVPLPLSACGGSDRSTPNRFAGHWSGHTRRLEISHDGRGREIVDDGCCSRVVTARFRLLHVSGTPAKAIATIRFTFARVDKGVLAALHRRPPHAEQLGTLRLERGVVTDEVTKVTFCAMNVDKCGL
jgi:hypothetical protein